MPTYGTQNVSQFAVSLLMEICSHIGHHDKAVKEGKWQNNVDWCFWDYPLIELADKTAGIIGLGRIGQATAKILGALNMEVIAYDAFKSDAGAAEGSSCWTGRVFSAAAKLFCPAVRSRKNLASNFVSMV